jgi:hypothetical protein
MVAFARGGVYAVGGDCCVADRSWLMPDERENLRMLKNLLIVKGKENSEREGSSSHTDTELVLDEEEVGFDGGHRLGYEGREGRILTDIS